MLNYFLGRPRGPRKGRFGVYRPKNCVRPIQIGARPSLEADWLSIAMVVPPVNKEITRTDEIAPISSTRLNCPKESDREQCE